MDRLESKRLRLLIKRMSKELKLFQKTNNVQFRDPNSESRKTTFELY